MSLSKGDRLGAYEIVALVGAGGMGEVFKATDTRVSRLVAVKVSKSEFTERFEQEAHAIAALNHPNICHLYDVGSAPNAPGYLVMEFIEGAPLQGPLPLDKVLEYAGQIAGALDTAHTKGITHRDLKPANILVTKSGVKLLDFGLAKIETPVSIGADEGTKTLGLTLQGAIVGTLHYMSPEQIQGRKVDSRSDIFSFGLLLYEMVTGKRAFDGSTAASIMGAILERPAPSITEVAPAALNRVMKRCLEKDPDDRWQSARDLRSALELMSLEPSAQPAVPASQARSRGVYGFAALALIAIIAAVAISVVHFRETPAVEPVRKFQIFAPEGQSYAGMFALSPNGMNLAFLAEDPSGKRRVFIRSLNSLDAKPITEVSNIGFSAWSPDSRAIYMGSKQVNIADGSEAPFSGPAWEEPGRDTHPHRLPDGRHVVLYRDNGIYLQSGEGGEPKLLKPDVAPTNFDFLSIPGAGGSGYLLFMQDLSLKAQKLDSSQWELTGNVFTVVNGMGRSAGGVGYFSTSQDGVLAYRTGVGDRVSVLLDRHGKQIDSYPGANVLAFSPDATKVAITKPAADSRVMTIMLVDLLSHREEQLTFGATRSSNPVWSPDGARIVFSSGPPATANNFTKVYVKPANGSQEAEFLYESGEGVYPNSWSRDGKYIVLSQRNPKTKWDLWIWNVAERKAVPLIQDAFDELRGQISPDGRLIAYASNESGTQEVYVRSFPDGKGKWLVSRGGGDEPRWSRDGRALFYRGRALYSVTITPGATPQFGSPQQVLEFRGVSPGQRQNAYWDVTPDGQRFLFTGIPPENYSGPITVVLNWPSTFNK